MDRNFSASNAVSTATVVNVTASSVTSPLMIETKHQSESFSLMCCEFLKKQRLVDLTLSSRSRSIQVHKIVLASRSDYFEVNFRLIFSKFGFGDVIDNYKHFHLLCSKFLKECFLIIVIFRRNSLRIH